MSRSASIIRTQTRLAVWFRDDLTCVYCGGTAPAVRLTLDHVEDRNDHNPRNLVTACLSCNSSRQDRSVSAFCKAKGFHKGTVWKRIRAQTTKPIEGYRTAVNLLVNRGMPDWLCAIRRGDDPPEDPSIPF